MTTTSDITTAVSTIVTALEHERDGLVTRLRVAEDRLLAARSLFAPNGPAAPPAVTRPPESRAGARESRAGARAVAPESRAGQRRQLLPPSDARFIARRAMQRGGKWLWERVRDSLVEHGGPMTFVVLERRLKSRNLRREVYRRPKVFEVCTVPKSGRGFRFKTAQAVRLVGTGK